MSQDYADSSPEYRSLSWSEVWISALTKPSVQTYRSIVRDPAASRNRAYAWVFISALIGLILSYLLGLATTGLFDADSLAGFGSGPLAGISIILLICLAPIVGVLSVVGLLITAGIVHLIARVLGGTGTYSDLIIAFGAYVAPFSLLATILAAIPFINLCLSIPLAIYYIALAVIAVNAVNEFGWGKAVVSAIIGPVAIAVFIACGVIFLFILGGPQIGDVFSRIIEDLSTPAP